MHRRRFLGALAATPALGLLRPGLAWAADAWAPPAGTSTNEWGDVLGYVHPMVFPVLGQVSYVDSFRASRGTGRTHEGQDILGAKMLPLLAVSDGTISLLTIPESHYGNALHLTADDGFVYSYLHVNNDTPGTDDGKAAPGDVFGPGITLGARVKAGQVVAYMGDSGNAEGVTAHLHFEMRAPNGKLVDPKPSLDAARRITADQVPGAIVPKPSPFARIAGPDRVATAIEVSKLGWPKGAAEVVLANGMAWAEALPATVLAAARGGPLLLHVGEALGDAVAAELARLKAKAVTVVGSVPAGVDAALAAKGLAVSRLGGVDAVEVAAAVAEEVGAPDGTVMLVNGSSFADAMSASALAASRQWPILFSTEKLIWQRSVDVWRELGAERVVLVGGPSVLGDNILAFVPGGVRLAGDDRYATSVAVVRESVRLGARLDQVLVATGRGFADALAAAPLAARLGGVVALVDGDGAGTDGAMRAYLAAQRAGVGTVRVMGGDVAVSSVADRLLQEALGRRTV